MERGGRIAPIVMEWRKGRTVECPYAISREPGWTWRQSEPGDKRTAAFTSREFVY
jgi:hypothetical protein